MYRGSFRKCFYVITWHYRATKPHASLTADEMLDIFITSCTGTVMQTANNSVAKIFCLTFFGPMYLFCFLLEIHPFFLGLYITFFFYDW